MDPSVPRIPPGAGLRTDAVRAVQARRSPEEREHEGFEEELAHPEDEPAEEPAEGEQTPARHHDVGHRDAEEAGGNLDVTG
jgi:hypothetical protein